MSALDRPNPSYPSAEGVALQLGYPNFMFIGPMGGGKTTAAQFLADEFGYDRRPIAGSHYGGIRNIAVLLFGKDAENDREKLNKLAVIDDQFPGIWIDTWERETDRRAANTYIPQYQRGAPIVVDDVRRDLEYDRLKARGFVTVRITAPEQLRIDRLRVSGKWQNEEQLTSRWEQWWPTAQADYEITNEDSKDDLYNEVIDVLIKERKRR